MTSAAGNPEAKGGRLVVRKDPPHVAGPGVETRHGKSLFTPLKKLFAYFGPYKYAIIAGVVLTMASAILALIGPQFVREVSDEIFSGIESGDMDTDLILRLSIIACAIYVVSVLCGIAQHYIMPVTSQRIANRLRAEMMHKVDRLPLNYYDNSSTGDIMSRITNDADNVGDQSSMTFVFLFSATTSIVGCILMMIYTNLILGLVAMVPPLAGFACMRMVVRKTQPLFVSQSRNLGAMNAHVEENYYGYGIVKAYGGEARSRRRFDEINDSLYNSAYKSRFITNTIPQIMGFMGNLGYLLVCIIGSMMIISGDITYGVVIAFILYVRMFYTPMMMLSDAFAGMQSLAASSTRVFELLEAPEMEDESEKKGVPEDVRGEVEFDDVCFSYIEGTEVIHDFSLTVRPGEKVAIVGPTGAGKTTLVNLLMRFYEVDSGVIRVDGTPVADMSRFAVHSMFSMVLQDIWLFDGTIRENLSFNMGEIPEETMVSACRAVGIHDFIASLPEGYDTRISGTSGLSSGQKQQLSIARAIIRDAPMVIFDEATSSIDTRTEKLIQQAVGKLTDGRTSFIIAHRLSTIRDCDKIIVMNDGRLVESGTHESLLEAGGFYAELYNSQFENCG